MSGKRAVATQKGLLEFLGISWNKDPPVKVAAVLMTFYHLTNLRNPFSRMTMFKILEYLGDALYTQKLQRRLINYCRLQLGWGDKLTFDDQPCMRHVLIKLYLMHQNKFWDQVIDGLSGSTSQVRLYRALQLHPDYQARLFAKKDMVAPWFLIPNRNRRKWKEAKSLQEYAQLIQTAQERKTFQKDWEKRKAIYSPLFDLYLPNTKEVKLLLQEYLEEKRTREALYFTGVKESGDMMERRRKLLSMAL